MLARVADVFVCVEQRSDIHRLATPNVPVDSPIKGKLQGSSIQRPEQPIRLDYHLVAYILLERNPTYATGLTAMVEARLVG